MMSNSIFDTSSINIKEMSDTDFYTEAEDKLHEILKHEFKEDVRKQQIKKTSSGLNFACPFCRDSVHDPKKKRGNFILKGKWAGTFKCFNCGKFMKISSFFNAFRVPLSLSALTYVSSHSADISLSQRNANEITSDVLDKESVIKYAVKRDVLKTYLGLLEIDKTDKKAYPGYLYLINRCQFNFSNFLYDPNGKYIVILNLIGNDLVFGFQVRDITGKRKSKYKTMTLENIHKAILKDGVVVPETVNALSTVFNIFNIDVYRPVLVTEGPFDAFLLPNCIAMAGANKSIGIDLPFWYVFDSDKTGNEHAIEKLNAGYYVFMWEKLKSDLGLPYENPYSKSSKWDINDVIIWRRDNNCTEKIYWSKYFSKDILDGLDI